MTFEQALTAMKDGQSVRRSADRYGNTRYYLLRGRIVEQGDTKDEVDVIVDPHRQFDASELLAEDWEVVGATTTTAK